MLVISNKANITTITTGGTLILNHFFKQWQTNEPVYVVSGSYFRLNAVSRVTSGQPKNKIWPNVVVKATAAWIGLYHGK